MSYKSQEEAEYKIKLMKNVWRILTMCGGSCLFTVILSIISSQLAWSDVAVLKVFLFAVIIVAGIFSIITLVITGMTIYFKITTLSEVKFREAVKEFVEEFTA